MSIKADLQEAMKTAMRGGDKPRLGVVRLMLAAVKQREVDDQKELDDAEITATLDKMAKQRRESIEQYEKAGREDLADQERFELTVLKDFLPEQLSEAEIDDLISAALEESGASSMKDMGKVMGILKPKLQGRADMGAVSGRIKAKLAG